MKKYFYFCVVALLATVTFGLASCSDDDEDESNELVGKWAIVEGDEFGLGNESTIFEFRSNGTMILTYEDSNGTHVSSNNTYSVNGNKLRINFDVYNGVADEYITGTYTLAGKEVKYVYSWQDGTGVWADTKEATMILERKK